MEIPYQIKIKKGTFEIEISGPDKDFISKELEEILNKLDESDVFFDDNSALVTSNSAPPTTNKTSGGSIAKLAMDAKVSEEDLNNIYEFKNNEICIHREIKGTDAEKQQIIAKLALISHEYVLNTNELNGKGLGSYMQYLGVSSTSNLAANLKRDKGIIKIMLC